MVGRQAIVSPLFQNKGKLSPLMMKKLMVRGGGIQVNDALERFGWGSTSAVAMTVMTVDTYSGVIRGARFETRGLGPEVRFKAKDLWQESSGNVFVKIKMNDLSRLPWLGVGGTRNQTEWIDSSNVDFEVEQRDRGTLDPKEYEAVHVKGFCLRFTLLPVKVDRAFLYGSIVPISKDSLMEKINEKGIEPSSALIPSIAMKLWVAKGKFQNGFPMDLLPLECETDKIGLGHLPLLECVGSTTPVLPEHDDVASQLALIMRNLNPMNNMNTPKVRSLLEDEGADWPQTATGTIGYEWPEETQSRGRVTSLSSTATGLFPYVQYPSLLISP